MNSFARFVTENGGKFYDIMYTPKLLNGKFCSCNTSCVWFKDSLVVNSRLVNYKKLYQSDDLKFLNGWQLAQTYIFNEGGFSSRNILSKFNGTELTDIHEIKYPNSIVPKVQYQGLEDCRLVVWNNKLYGYGTRWDRVKDKGCICIYEIDENGNGINEIIIKPQNEKTNCEKNWGAVEDRPFTFVYSNNPTQVIEVNQRGECCLVNSGSHNDEIKDWIKGSTQVIRYSDDEYISLVHTNRHYDKGNTGYNDYVTAFIFYDNDFNVTRMSDWFVFNSPMCEFTCGLAKHGDDIYITYSQLDCTSHLIVTNKQTIEAFMKAPENSVSADMFYDYYALAKKYEDNNQLNASYVLFNYAAQLANTCKFPVDDELKLECIIKTYCGLVDFGPEFLAKSLYLEITNSLNTLIERYPNVCEFYYIASAFYKMCGNKKDEYIYYKKLGDEHKVNVHNYFLKYFNPNYL